MSSLSSISATTQLGAAQEALQRGLDQSARALQSFAQGWVDPQNMISFIQGQRTVEAGLANLRSADEQTGTLLNVKV
jgi:hypothetical protein